MTHMLYPTVMTHTIITTAVPAQPSRHTWFISAAPHNQHHVHGHLFTFSSSTPTTFTATEMSFLLLSSARNEYCCSYTCFVRGVFMLSFIVWNQVWWFEKGKGSTLVNLLHDFILVTRDDWMNCCFFADAKFPFLFPRWPPVTFAIRRPGKLGWTGIFCGPYQRKHQWACRNAGRLSLQRSWRPSVKTTKHQTEHQSKLLHSSNDATAIHDHRVRAVKLAVLTGWERLGK